MALNSLKLPKRVKLSPEVVSVVVFEYVDSCIYVTLARCFKLVRFFPSLCYPIQLKTVSVKLRWRNCYCHWKTRRDPQEGDGGYC